MFVKQIPNEDLNLKNTGMFLGTHPTCRFQLSRGYSPKPGSSRIWPARDPCGCKCDPNRRDQILCPGLSCPGTAALLPEGSLIPLSLHPLAPINFPADLTIVGFAATATIKGKLYPPPPPFSFLLASSSHSWLLLDCSPSPQRGTLQEGHPCFAQLFSRGMSPPRDILNMVCHRSFMHTKGGKGELIKIIISFPFFYIYIYKQISAKGIGAKNIPCLPSLMNNGGMWWARPYDQGLMKTRNYPGEPNPLGWNPSFPSQTLQQLFNSFNVTFFKTSLVPSPAVNEILWIFSSLNAPPTDIHYRHGWVLPHRTSSSGIPEWKGVYIYIKISFKNIYFSYAKIQSNLWTTTFVHWLHYSLAIPICLQWVVEDKSEWVWKWVRAGLMHCLGFSCSQTFLPHLFLSPMEAQVNKPYYILIATAC